MKNPTGIVRQGAYAFVALCDFTIPTIPANPTPTDFENAAIAIEAAVIASTNTLSFQKWGELMIGNVQFSEEFGDVRSVKLATGEEYLRSSKVKGTITIDVKNAADPYLMQILTGVKLTKSSGNTFYRNQKFINRNLQRLVVKIVTAPDENNKQDTYYFMPATPGGSLLKKFQDYGENDYDGSELTLEILSGGQSFELMGAFNPTLNENSSST